MEVLDIERVLDASGSAINGTKLMIPELPHGQDKIFVATAGYDQRLNIWQIKYSKLLCGTSSYRFISILNCIDSREEIHSDNYNYQVMIADTIRKCQRVEASLLIWTSAMMTFIGDVNSLDIHLSRVENKHDKECDYYYNVAVIGEGFQIFDCKI